MNPQNLMKALKYLESGLSPAKSAASAAAKVTKKRVAGPDVPMARYARPDSAFPASMESVTGSMSTMPNPAALRWTQTPLTPQSVRQAALTEADLGAEAANAAMLAPSYNQVRNVSLGTGLGIGAIPPSIIALYLLAQQEEEKKKQAGE